MNIIPRIQDLTICALLSAPALAQTAPPTAMTPPVKGVVQSFDGKTLSVVTANNEPASAAIGPETKVVVSVKRTLADIKPGDFVASGGTRDADGKIHANEIRILSGPIGEGQFPMNAPGQVMTNATVKTITTGATVKKVSNAGGIPTLKLSFHGAGAPGAANCTGRSADAPSGAGKGCVGETEFDVPADTPVVAWLPGDVQMLKSGAKITMFVVQGMRLVIISP